MRDNKSTPDHTFTEFHEVWESAAEKAKQEGLRNVTCPMLTSDGLCQFQIEGRKPSICSYSLSEEAVSESITPGHFFHEECGWLAGATDPFRSIVKAWRVGNGRSDPEGRKTAAHRQVDMLARRSWRILEGHWVPGPGTVWRSPITPKSKKWERRRRKKRRSPRGSIVFDKGRHHRTRAFWRRNRLRIRRAEPYEGAMPPVYDSDMVELIDQLLLECKKEEEATCLK
jgi:hypothetical protein